MRCFTLPLLFLLGLIGLAGELSAQTIWPGDVNNNGTVNEVDVLYLGWAFGAAGPERPGASTDWEPQPAPAPWSQSFPDGLNYFHADVDGNGFVDEDDFDDGVEDNFGLTHGPLLGDDFANTTDGAAPQVVLRPAASIVGLGTQIDVDLLVEGEGNPSPVYGLALQLSFGTNQGSMTGELEFESLSDNWLESGGADLLEIETDDEDLGQASLALVRTDQQAVTPMATELGAFSVIIEDIVVGLQADTFWIKIDSVRVVGESFATVPARIDSTQVIVARNPDSLLLGAGSSYHGLGRLRVYPNPSASVTWIESSVPIKHWQLRSATTGQLVSLPLQPAGQGRWCLHWPAALPAGTYLLTGQGPGGAFRQRLIRLPND